MTREQIERLIDQETETVNNLSKKYQGVRPSWVSCELSLMLAQIEELKNQLEKRKERYNEKSIYEMAGM